MTESSANRRHDVIVVGGGQAGLARGSALLGWVKDDAEYIAQQISTFRPAQADPLAAERAA